MKKWVCYVCGKDIVEGQLFTFTNKGPVHQACLQRAIAPKLYQSATDAALFELLSLANEGIVKIKSLEELIADEEAKRLAAEFRKSLEGFAARLTNKLVERIGA